MNNLEHIIEKILVYYFCNEYIVLPLNYFEIITPKIPNLLIITNILQIDFTNKQIATKQWETYTNEFKLNLMSAKKIIIFSDLLSPTIQLQDNIIKNNIICCICLEENTYNKTYCCRQPLHIKCYKNWNKTCPFCRHKNYEII